MTGTHPLALFDLDDLVGDEERAIQQTVREVMDAQVRPHVAQWYDEGSLPAERSRSSSARSACWGCT